MPGEKKEADKQSASAEDQSKPKIKNVLVPDFKCEVECTEPPPFECEPPKLPDPEECKKTPEASPCGPMSSQWMPPMCKEAKKPCCPKPGPVKEMCKGWKDDPCPNPCDPCSKPACPKPCPPACPPQCPPPCPPACPPPCPPKCLPPCPPPCPPPAPVCPPPCPPPCPKDPCSKGGSGKASVAPSGAESASKKKDAEEGDKKEN